MEGVDAVLAALEGAPSEQGADTRESLRQHYLARRDHLARSADADTDEDPVNVWSGLHLKLIAVERGAVGLAYDENRLTDEARRRIERELDLDEARVRDASASGGASDTPCRSSESTAAVDRRLGSVRNRHGPQLVVTSSGR